MNTFNNMIIVWRFEDAPEEFRALSHHGGDEDWVALVPKTMADSFIPMELDSDPEFAHQWADQGTSFGCCDVSEHFLPTGEKVLIGAHHS
jgi:hypothetical protein